MADVTLNCGFGCSSVDGCQGHCEAPTRTISLADMTPTELADLFARLSSVGQAEFFNHVPIVAGRWKGMGWCGQCAHIVDMLDDAGTDAVMTLAGHIIDRGDLDIAPPLATVGGVS